MRRATASRCLAQRVDEIGPSVALLPRRLVPMHGRDLHGLRSQGALWRVLTGTCAQRGARPFLSADLHRMPGRHRRAAWPMRRLLVRPARDRAALCERLGHARSRSISAGAPAPPPPLPIRRSSTAPARRRHYDGTARILVHRLKYGDGWNSRMALGTMMARAGAELLAEADVIVPVPLHRWRLWRRRFNQAMALGRVSRPRAAWLRSAPPRPRQAHPPAGRADPGPARRRTCRARSAFPTRRSARL